MSIIHEYHSDDVDNKLWICNTCKSSLKKTSTSTTSQLWVHLRSCHPKLASEAEEKKKQDIKKRQLRSVNSGIDPKQSKLKSLLTRKGRKGMMLLLLQHSITGKRTIRRILW